MHLYHQFHIYNFWFKTHKSWERICVVSIRVKIILSLVGVPSLIIWLSNLEILLVTFGLTQVYLSKTVGSLILTVYLRLMETHLKNHINGFIGVQNCKLAEKWILQNGQLGTLAEKVKLHFGRKNCSNR